MLQKNAKKAETNRGMSLWGLLAVMVIMFVLMIGSQIGLEMLFDKDAYLPLKNILMKTLAHIAPQEIIFTSIMGMWLGIIAWRVNSIWLTILCHAIINGTFSFYMLGKQLWLFPEDIPMGCKILFSVALLYTVKILIQKKNTLEYVNLQNT